MSESELIYLLALQRIPYVGDITAKKLVHHFGSAEAIFKAKKDRILAIDGVGHKVAKLLDFSAYEREVLQEINFIQENGIKVTYFEESTYPEHLKHCIDAPILLFEKGNIDLQHKKIISIVGTRKATNHGIAFCEQLISELAPLNPVIVSGFAYGIDICAHKAALANNLQTVACLAHGLNQIYPKSHQKYKNEVLKNGGFISDFWSDKTFDRKNFLKRNRVIAGISEATIVIESAEKGGSLVTADIAHSYNREVFAVPGRTTDSFSKGCNELIKTQKAQLITSAADLVYYLGWEIEENKPKQTQLFVDLSGEEEKVLNELKKLGKTELDVLALACQMPTFEITTYLLSLELNGLVRPLPGKMFEVI
ncbi:DNA-processing protein DprA [Mesonia aestuariivivens]|uniref:DNA-processing protein DprA n=1 Tax=Mesonia aestuariivivens TaxID=2796128 RepID=A0ABS6W1B8_9FLAO|nr:DNA-processing protein DprA [Mesonia aestuariivivens]MBW2961636.1 DNA-processing protein DprA [Mesonia aestuariivivens]